MRKVKREVTIGNLTIGGHNPVAVQTMLNVRADDVAGNVAQAVRGAEAGCQIVRVSVPTLEDVRLIEAIKNAVDIPLVADIHFNHRIALALSLIHILRSSSTCSTSTPAKQRAKVSSALNCGHSWLTNGFNGLSPFPCDKAQPAGGTKAPPAGS